MSAATLDSRQHLAQQCAMFSAASFSFRMLSGLAMFGSFSCVTTQLTPFGRRVQLVREEAQVAGCSFVGNVEGSSSMTGVSRHQGMKSATNEMLNQAGDLGATHVIFTSDPRAAYWTTSEEASGRAFRCAAGSPSHNLAPVAESPTLKPSPAAPSPAVPVPAEDKGILEPTF